MNSLQVFERFDKDGIELVINTQTGESFATQAGYCRMSGKAKSTISERFGKLPLNEAEIQTPGGIQGVRLINEDLIAEWLPKDNPLMSTQLLKLGVRVFLHKLAGYEVRSTATFKIPQTYAEALLEAGRLALENEKLSAKIEQDAPLVSFAESVQASDDAIDFNDFAKAINTGRTRLFRLMRELGVVMKNTTIPYQRWIDAGYFEVSQEVTPDGKLRPFALVTGKGQIWLKQKIDAYGDRQQRMADLVVQGVLGF
jgi:phage antirepressor YoqD-like protein